MSLEIVRLHDEALVNGELVKGSDRNSIIGVVEITASNGDTIFSKRVKEIYKNDLLIGGCVYFLEKTYGIRSAFTPRPLDIELGVNTTVDNSVDTLKNERIIGIVTGVGGSRDLYNTVVPVQRHKRTVNDIIPFRMKDVELFGDEAADYFLKTKTSDGYFAYYGKKFRGSPEIKVMYESGVPVPNDVGDLINTNRIDAYAESNLLISNKDIREMFLLRDGSTDRSRINTIGLVSGYPITNANGQVEYANVRVITTLNMENRELKNDVDTITIKYKQYII